MRGSVPFVATMIALVAIVLSAVVILSQPGPVDGECTVDAECIRTGCSDEICASEEVFSICVYLPEYACNQYRECKCIDGTCMWTNTTEYERCITNL